MTASIGRKNRQKNLKIFCCRNMYRYEYITLLDTDEVIVPTSEATFTKIFCFHHFSYSPGYIMMGGIRENSGR